VALEGGGDAAGDAVDEGGRGHGAHCPAPPPRLSRDPRTNVTRRRAGRSAESMQRHATHRSGPRPAAPQGRAVPRLPRRPAPRRRSRPRRAPSRPGPPAPACRPRPPRPRREGGRPPNICQARRRGRDRRIVDIPLPRLEPAMPTVTLPCARRAVAATVILLAI